MRKKKARNISGIHEPDSQDWNFAHNRSKPQEMSGKNLHNKKILALNPMQTAHTEKKRRRTKSIYKVLIQNEMVTVVQSFRFSDCVVSKQI